MNVEIFTMVQTWVQVHPKAPLHPNGIDKLPKQKHTHTHTHISYDKLWQLVVT